MKFTRIFLASRIILLKIWSKLCSSHMNVRSKTLFDDRCSRTGSWNWIFPCLSHLVNSTLVTALCHICHSCEEQLFTKYSWNKNPYSDRSYWNVYDISNTVFIERRLVYKKHRYIIFDRSWQLMYVITRLYTLGCELVRSLLRSHQFPQSFRVWWRDEVLSCVFDSVDVTRFCPFQRISIIVAVMRSIVDQETLEKV
jgi:hypothetical protein